MATLTPSPTPSRSACGDLDRHCHANRDTDPTAEFHADHYADTRTYRAANTYGDAHAHAASNSSRDAFALPVLRLNYETSYYGCAWMGVAGTVVDIDGNPLMGYPVHVWGGASMSWSTRATNRSMVILDGSNSSTMHLRRSAASSGCRSTRGTILTIRPFHPRLSLTSRVIVPGRWRTLSLSRTTRAGRVRQSQVAMTLYIVGTPIGNLEDITLRALRILRDVSLIAAENTRKAGVLLSHYQITTPVTSYYEGNERRRIPEILEALERGDVALISEAGMPGISDPGYPLIEAAIQRGVPVVPVPGASAHTLALVVSGLPTDQFLFVGFLPRKRPADALRALASNRATLIFYEAPHRLEQTLTLMHEILGNRPVALCRELDEALRGSMAWRSGGRATAGVGPRGGGPPSTR